MLRNDLRAYLDKLDTLGMLTTVHDADWDEEMGVITELMTERGGPALLFDRIKGYPEGFRVATNVYPTLERMALALGLDYKQPLIEAAEEWDRVMQACELVPPREVPDGPILENVLMGDDVDLFKFPTPKWHDRDEDRYIGTGVCVIQRDPDTGFVNSGSYRVAIHDKTTCCVFIEPDRDGDLIRRKHWERGEKCPVVVPCPARYRANP